MPAVDFVEVRLEESPLNQVTWDDAATPSRVSTDKLYLPSRTALLGPQPGYLSRADELRGIAGSVADLIDIYTPNGSFSVRAYPKDLTWLLTLAGWTGVKTAGDGVITDPDSVVIPAGGPQRWVFTKKTGIVAQSAQVKINYANEAVLLQGNGYGVSELGLNAAGEMTGDLLGCYLQRLAVDSSTVPVLVSQATPPFRRGDLTLTWLTGGGTPEDFDITISNPLEGAPGWLLNPASFFPSGLEFAGDQQVQVRGSIPKRVLDADDYDALINASTFVAKARWKSTKSIAATSYKYSLWLEMPACQYVGGDAAKITNQRRRGASYDWYASWDETLGYDAKITLVNDVTAINTFA